MFVLYICYDLSCLKNVKLILMAAKMFGGVFHYRGQHERAFPWSIDVPIKALDGMW